MDTGLKVVWAAIALSILMGFVGMAVLPGWLRTRRREAVRRQIVLTDALDERLGPIVSPVVKWPLLGPWRIQIAVPLARPSLVGRVLAVAHETLSAAEGMGPSSYRIVLTAQPDSIHEPRETRARRTAGRWAGHPVAAA